MPGKNKTKAKARKATKSRAKTVASKVSKNSRKKNNSNPISQLQSELQSRPKASKASKVSKASKDKKPNTKTLIRNGGKDQKRKVIKITPNKFKTNRFDLDSESYIEYYPNFLTKNTQDKVLQELIGGTSLEFQNLDLKKSKIPWQHGYYSMYGRDIPTPRLLYAMRDSSEDITKSYSVTDSMPWTPEIEKIRNRLIKKTGQRCRYAQMNMYRDGNDYIGFHTDSEVGTGDMIASISLGAERSFRFISKDFKNNAKPMYEMTLEPGSLLIMSEYAAKHNWKHELPKDKGVDDLRVNITFRPN